jgi:hypothetical protein
MLISNDDYWAMMIDSSIEVTLAIDSDDETTIYAIFNRPAKVYGDDLRMVSPDPTLTCRSTDIENIKQGSTVKVNVNDTLYTTRITKADGTGITVLELKK